MAVTEQIAESLALSCCLLFCLSPNPFQQQGWIPTMKRIISGCFVTLAIAVAVLVTPTAASAATPVEDMGCGKVLWASSDIFDHPSGTSPSGNVTKYKGCLVKRGWSKRVYRAMKDRQWRLSQKLNSSSCTAEDPTPYLSGVTRTKYKGVRVVVFKYRFGWLTAC